ncbi:uncharacterized protein LOC113369876 isoform X2 [Ctenocephalides felis]|nr:uncharacterized protein LOC113369876 isoform X2 [Ctenocephalides felis]
MWRTNFTRLIQTYGSSAIPRPLSHRASAQNGFGSALDVSAEVRQALEGGKPVVALESTIITHGMPWPSNFETAIAVENVVREQGAIPATIAILSGRIKVGLLPDELELLAKPKDSSVKPPPIKVSRRDIPYALANNLDGGTTVAGTMIAAHMAGIPIFATGGIGGVHRGGEDSMDISADLVELGRTPVSVICAGVKSILDIERTLEYLETQGVPVAVLAECNFFPAFYACSHAGLKAPQHVTTVLQAAKLIAMSRKAQLSNGSLIAVPVPEEFAMDEKQVDEAIATALKKASNAHVRGKEVTPFLLQAIKEITHGRSLETNIALVKNNAKTGAQIALELIKLENCERTSDINNEVKKCQEKMIYHDQKRYHHTLTPVVVGGSNADIYIKVTDPDIK